MWCCEMRCGVVSTSLEKTIDGKAAELAVSYDVEYIADSLKNHAESRKRKPGLERADIVHKQLVSLRNILARFRTYQVVIRGRPTVLLLAAVGQREQA